jgi:fucose permease
MEKNKDDRDEATGCVVTKEDTPFVLATIICCVSFVIYGMAAASLGPALPTLSRHYNVPISQMGTSFTSRGVGYMIGTILSGYALSFKTFPFSKEFMTCLCTFLMGVTLFIIDQTTNFSFSLFVFFVQGFNYGIVDTMGNCALPDFWGRRVQPWMQTMHAAFGVGAIIGPAIVGGFGYRTCFQATALVSVIPLVAILFINLFGFGNPKFKRSSSSEGGLDNLEEVEEIIPGRPSPYLFKLLVTSFFFTYVGAETGYAGWIPTYALVEGITTSESKAAYLTAIFWAALTIGRILGIPSSIFMSSTFMIRVYLFLAVIVGICILTILTASYSIAAFITGFAGFALAAMFPVMMTIFGDYGYQVDSTSTTMFMVGATLGESMVPMLIGMLMAYIHPFMLPLVTFLGIILLVVIYFTFHVLSKQEQKNYLQTIRDTLEIGDDTMSESSEHATTGLVSKKFGGSAKKTHDKNVYNPIASKEMFTIKADDDDDEDDDDDLEMVRFEVIHREDSTDHNENG